MKRLLQEADDEAIEPCGKEGLIEMAEGKIDVLRHIPYMAFERFMAHTTSFGGALHCKIEQGHEFFYRVKLRDALGNDIAHFNDSAHLIRGQETSDDSQDVIVVLYRKSHLILRSFAENPESTARYLFEVTEVDCSGPERERRLLVVDTINDVEDGEVFIQCSDSRIVYNQIKKKVDMLIRGSEGKTKAKENARREPRRKKRLNEMAQTDEHFQISSDILRYPKLVINTFRENVDSGDRKILTPAFPKDASFHYEASLVDFNNHPIVQTQKSKSLCVSGLAQKWSGAQVYRILCNTMLDTCDAIMSDLRAISTEKVEQTAPSGYRLYLSEINDAANEKGRDIISLAVSRTHDGCWEAWLQIPDSKAVFSLTKKKMLVS